MKKLDMRFDEITFKNIIGQTFHKYYSGSVFKTKIRGLLSES